MHWPRWMTLNPIRACKLAARQAWEWKLRGKNKVVWSDQHTFLLLFFKLLGARNSFWMWIKCEWKLLLHRLWCLSVCLKTSVTDPVRQLCFRFLWVMQQVLKRNGKQTIILYPAAVQGAATVIGQHLIKATPLPLSSQQMKLLQLCTRKHTQL